jgi:NAD(P)-dependent dehydrogenase (short-subunit alcohol dehydrogenase family)
MRTGGAVIDFSGQAAIVTGAGRGLGRLYAHELARRGAQVVVNDIGGSMSGAGSDTNVADGVVEEIRQAGGTAVASYDSVDTPEGGAAIVQTAVDAFGRVDAVVSNAGIYETARFDQVTPERWRKMLEVHLDGGFYLAQPAYAAAKAGLIGLTNVIAIEGARHGIRANTVLPIGYSRMVSESVGDRPLTDTEEAFFKRIEPERVVPLVVYFASRACEVSHHNVSAAAGRYARAFMGLSEGWLADPEASPPSADDIAEHYAEIASTDRFAVPMSSYEEIVGVCERLGIQ